MQEEERSMSVQTYALRELVELFIARKSANQGASVISRDRPCCARSGELCRYFWCRTKFDADDRWKLAL